MQEAARAAGVHVVWGSYERGPQRGVVFNSAALIGPDGDLLGVYRKTHPYCTELRSRGGWVTPGDEVCVVDTALGRIGMIICFDGDYPELSRITAVRGAEVIARPSALLRSADIWELTNRARAYDNHVYVIGANATGADPGGAIYFGNSMIVTPIAEVVARAASHEGWVSARLDPATRARVADPGIERGAGVRPPGRPQPGPDPPLRGRPRRPGEDPVPARALTDRRQIRPAVTGGRVSARAAVGRAPRGRSSFRCRPRDPTDPGVRGITRLADPG